MSCRLHGLKTRATVVRLISDTGFQPVHSAPDRKRMSDIAVPISAETPKQKSFLAHAKLIGFFTLISRFLGLGREMVAGHYLGTGLVASAFTVAFTIPNLFRKLFGEGALSAAFIPLYAQARKSDSKEANDFAAASVNLLC